METTKVFSLIEKCEHICRIAELFWKQHESWVWTERGHVDIEYRFHGYCNSPSKK